MDAVVMDYIDNILDGYLLNVKEEKDERENEK
jgi:hypothetical protein